MVSESGPAYLKYCPIDSDVRWAALKDYSNYLKSSLNAYASLLIEGI